MVGNVLTPQISVCVDTGPAAGGKAKLRVGVSVFQYFSKALVSLLIPAGKALAKPVSSATIQAKTALPRNVSDASGW